MAVTFAVGAVTGTCAAFEFGRWKRHKVDGPISPAMLWFSARRRRVAGAMSRADAAAAILWLGASPRCSLRGPLAGRCCPLAAGAVVAVVWGWGVAQLPYQLPTSLTAGAAAAPDPTLDVIFAVFGAAVVLVLPALALLYALSQRELLGEGN
jgi:cytochrome bd-type quinol oxidase subunit 2